MSGLTAADILKQRDPTYVDQLDEDPPLNSEGRLWYCVSFLSPEGVMNCSLRALKVRGFYKTQEEANARAEEIKSFDPYFHVFVGQCGLWLPWDPDPNEETNVESQIFQEKQMNDLMGAYKDQLKKAKTAQSQRKSDMTRNAAMQQNSREKTRHEKAREKARRKLDQRRANKKLQQQASALPNVPDVASVETADEPQVGGKKNKPVNQKLEDLQELEADLDERNDVALQERERLTATEKEIRQSEHNLQNADHQLAQMKALLNKFNKGS